MSTHPPNQEPRWTSVRGAQYWRPSEPTSYRQQPTGSPQRPVGDPPPDGNPQQPPGYPPPLAGYPQQPAAGFPPPPAGHSPLPGGYLPPPSGYPPRPAGYPPPPAGHPQPPEGHLPPPSGYPQLPAGHLPPPSGYPPRPAGYPPPSGYPPPAGYSASSGYPQRSIGYPQRPGGWGQQSGGWGEPSPWAFPPRYPIPGGPSQWGTGSQHRRTYLKLAAIIMAAVLGMVLVRAGWGWFTPDRTQVHTPQGVELQANGLPVGYHYLDEEDGWVSRLVCGPVSWELIGSAPKGGEDAIHEALDLMREMTGFEPEPADQVTFPSVELTFEFVTREVMLERASPDQSVEAVGLAQVQYSRMGITRADILLDEKFFRSMWQVDRDAAVLVVLHELGHALGLDHTMDVSSFMYPSVDPESRITDSDVVAFEAVLPDC